MITRLWQVLYLQWSSSNLYSRYTSLGESKENSFTGDTDIIIPWSHETNKSLHIGLWRGYGHQILKTLIPWRHYLMISWLWQIYTFSNGGVIVIKFEQHFFERSQWGTPSQVIKTSSPDHKNMWIYCQYIFFYLV